MESVASTLEFIGTNILIPVVASVIAVPIAYLLFRTFLPNAYQRRLNKVNDVLAIAVERERKAAAYERQTKGFKDKLEHILLERDSNLKRAIENEARSAAAELKVAQLRKENRRLSAQLLAKSEDFQQLTEQMRAVLNPDGKRAPPNGRYPSDQKFG